MPTLQQQIADKFLAELAKSTEVSAEENRKAPFGPVRRKKAEGRRFREDLHRARSR